MNRNLHSVMLDKNKCVGCTSCLKRCPTEAIRVHSGRAHIIDERCIDCGECIRACSHHAKVAMTDPLSTINRFAYKIALPAPALYGQFKQLNSISSVARGLRMMGFDEVFDVARGADIVTCAVRERLSRPDCPRPLISSSCPAVMRLIQTKYPDLIDNIVDVKSPMEVAAIEARRAFAEKHGVDPKDIGCFFITPCAAKATAIRNPLGHDKSAVDGAISIMEIFGLLSNQIRKHAQTPPGEDSFIATRFGIGWARTGGEATAAEIENALAVDGIEHVGRVLEEIENNRLSDLTLFEGLACVGGCVGGPLVYENGFISRNRIRQLILRLPEIRPFDVVTKQTLDSLADQLYFNRELKPVKALQLDPDLSTALAKMDRIAEIKQKLPGLDCGSCGSPTCSALAEDIVMGFASEMDCLFILKDRIREMAKQLVDLSESTRM